MTLDSELYDAAINLIETRLASSAWKTAAAVRLDDGRVLSGIGLAIFSAAAGLCAEVGPLAQAYTDDRAVVASICVNRSDDREPGPRPRAVRCLPGAPGPVRSRRPGRRR